MRTDNNSFENIGKKMPYAIPEDFFCDMQKKLLAEAEAQQASAASQPAATRKARHIWLGVAGTLAAAMLAGVIFLPRHMSVSSGEETPFMAETTSITDQEYVETTELYYSTMSDGELAQAVAFCDNDIFVN